MKLMNKVSQLLIVGMFLLLSWQVMAESELSGRKSVYLVDKSEQKLKIGDVHFNASVDGVSYKLVLEREKFQDYFLSMKEMKCLEGDELWCHLPYPYQSPRVVKSDDFRWLEHDLLFMFKKKEAFGANFWNGIYYKMSFRNGRIEGTAQAVDLNMLAAPPEDQSIPPVSEADLDEADIDLRWLPYLVIE